MEIPGVSGSLLRGNQHTDLVLLGSHVERVLWSFGIVLSTPAPEQVWMDVFVDDQFENVRLMLRA
jgi:hypothetical protein